MTAIAAAIVALLLALDSAVASSSPIPVGALGASGEPMTPQGVPSAPTPAVPATDGLGVRTGGSPPHLIPPLCSGPCPTPARFIRGLATWYDDGPGLYAAMPGWHYHQTPYPVAVCSFHDGRSWCVSLFVRDFCACGNGHVIDLSPAAFRALGWPLSRGVAKVTVERP